MPIQQSIPVLGVADVARSMQWYQAHLGFVPDPFPETPPYDFAILRSGDAELMLRCEERTTPRVGQPYTWDVYLRLADTPFRELFARYQSHGIVSRRLERMFYGLAEFEVTDPDGHVLCLSQQLDDMDDLPEPEA